MTTPYIPYIPGAGSPLRTLYRTTAQVMRLVPALGPKGGMSMSYEAVSAIVDPLLGEPGLLLCRLDLTFVRPGKDQPAPLVAGRAPDRVGVCYFDLATDSSGVPLVIAGDRLQCVAGPVFGMFELRVIPDVAQDYIGAHHVETQVIEVAQSLQPGSPTPFPGGAP